MAVPKIQIPRSLPDVGSHTIVPTPLPAEKSLVEKTLHRISPQASAYCALFNPVSMVPISIGGHLCYINLLSIEDLEGIESISSTYSLKVPGFLKEAVSMGLPMISSITHKALLPVETSVEEITLIAINDVYKYIVFGPLSR